MTDYDDYQADSENREGVSRLLAELEDALQKLSDPRDIFRQFVSILEDDFDICKGMLAVKEGQEARFLAVATWNNGRIRKNLSLRLPSIDSLFARVIEHGQMYAQNFAELYDGSVIEKQLLINEDTRSFMLRPLKYEASVIGLLGFSSYNPDAFLLFEEGVFDNVMDRLAVRLAEHEMTRTQH